MRADSGSSCQGLPGPLAGSAGASSRITWALVPPKPNALTPARRGPSWRGQSRSALLTKNGLPAKSICGLGVSKCRLGGSWLCSIASTALSSPAMPAAASRWPTFGLTEPIAQNWRLSVLRRNALVSARTSIGSPSGVPVPWVSM